jgi:hypothetical protein
LTTPNWGQVEIGGWDAKFCVQNPPPSLLKQECHRNTIWILRHASALPEIHMAPIEITVLDGTARKVTAVVENHGYLPTNITNRAKAAGVVKNDVFRIAPGLGMTVVGQAKHEIEFIEGYMNGQGDRPAKSTARASWIIQAEPGATGRIEFRSQRGGTVGRDFQVT